MSLLDHWTSVVSFMPVVLEEELDCELDCDGEGSNFPDVLRISAGDSTLASSTDGALMLATVDEEEDDDDAAGTLAPAFVNELGTLSKPDERLPL
jgi:hypothetical protein